MSSECGYGENPRYCEFRLSPLHSMTGRITFRHMGAQGFLQYSKLVWKHGCNQYWLWAKDQLWWNAAFWFASTIVLFFKSPESWAIALGTAGNAILSGIGGLLLVAIPVFLRFLIVASSELYWSKEEEIALKDKQINDLKKNLQLMKLIRPDMPLGEAIDYIRSKKKKYMLASEDSILLEICDLARIGGIKIWGKKYYADPEEDWGDPEAMTDTRSEIPSGLFAYYESRSSNYDGFILNLSEKCREELEEYSNQYCQVEVNCAQIDVHFE